MLRGLDFEGSHAETKGLSSTGQVIQVPEHAHEVSLDFTRIELSARYAIRDSWQIVGRLPFDIKEQRSKLRFVAPATSDEKAAMRRNMELHHRSDTYAGFSDASLLLARRTPDVLRAGDRLVISGGTSLPIGQTERDPFEAGDAGERHRHIQFGSGTFDPLIEVTYRLPLSRSSYVTLFTTGRFPLYENRKRYQGPVESTASFALGHALSEKVEVHASYSLFLQGFAHWGGDRDDNTGVVSHLVLVGTGYRLDSGLSVGLDLRIPLSQKARGGGDAFEQGLTVLFNASYGF